MEIDRGVLVPGVGTSALALLVEDGVVAPGAFSESIGADAANSLLDAEHAVTTKIPRKASPESFTQPYLATDTKRPRQFVERSGLEPEARD